MNIFKKAIGVLCVLTLLFGVSVCGFSKTAEASSKTEPALSETAEASSGEQNTKKEADTQSKILVAYFSATGNTKAIAESVAELVGADFFEIVPSEPYTDEDLDYNNDNCRANQEQQDSKARPEISGTVENMENYDVVLIGHPIWWGEEPRIVDTFMESYDLSGKTVVNFCTSGGSGIAKSTENLKALAPDANWLEGCRFEKNASEETIQEWIDSLKL